MRGGTRGCAKKQLDGVAAVR